MTAWSLAMRHRWYFFWLYFLYRPLGKPGLPYFQSSYPVCILGAVSYSTLLSSPLALALSPCIPPVYAHVVVVLHSQSTNNRLLVQNPANRCFSSIASVGLIATSMQDWCVTLISLVFPLGCRQCNLPLGRSQMTSAESDYGQLNPPLGHGVSPPPPPTHTHTSWEVGICRRNPSLLVRGRGGRQREDQRQMVFIVFINFVLGFSEEVLIPL